jgi:hypothetical protein
MTSEHEKLLRDYIAWRKEYMPSEPVFLAIAALLKEVEELRKPSWYYDKDNHERGGSELEFAVSNNCQGDIVTVIPCHYLPPIYVLIGKNNEHLEFSSSENARRRRAGEGDDG